MDPLAKQEKSLLLKLARQAINRRLRENRFELERVEVGGLMISAGAFVTLHCEEELRGCIGRIRSTDPLYATVQEMAISAAFQDPRFPPLNSDEFASLTIEISVLSPPEPIEDPERIVVGEHGLIISYGAYSGLLLPQVAIEWEWDRETFLNHACLKAGLPEDEWRRNGVRMEIFTAQVFSELSEKIGEEGP